MVVVFDSNVLIPLVLQASRSTGLFLRLKAAGHVVAVSPQMLEEVADKLRTKEPLRRWFGLPDADLEEFVHDLATICRVVAGTRQASGAVPADPKDDMVIAAALEAGAEYIISEDKHLTTLGQYHGIRILNREQFAAELDRLATP
jgi:putative PIN family toxin of toxin-antitoxin system